MACEQSVNLSPKHDESFQKERKIQELRMLIPEKLVITPKWVCSEEGGEYIRAFCQHSGNTNPVCNGSMWQRLDFFHFRRRTLPSLVFG